MAENNKQELVFKDEEEMLNHPAVLKAIDSKVSEAEQDAYDKIERIKEAVISQAISIGLETDHFMTRALKAAIEEGDDEKVNAEYSTVKDKMGERSLDSLCDTLTDLSGEYLRQKKDSKSIQKKLQDAMDKEPGDGSGDDKDKKDDTDNKDQDNKDDKSQKGDDNANDDKDTKDDDKDSKDKKDQDDKGGDNKDQQTKEPSEDINNPEGGDSSDGKEDDDDDPFGRVTKD